MASILELRTLRLQGQWAQLESIEEGYDGIVVSAGLSLYLLDLLSSANAVHHLFVVNGIPLALTTRNEEGQYKRDEYARDEMSHR